VDYAEQESLISELETKIERLRALYDQYFMGFEKIEPMVQRKDVDRKLYILRREQIRNTALRFRFNQVVSRYNTFATHWQRLLREIENGTYKRDVARAAKRFGSEALTIQAKRRLKGRGAVQEEAAPEAAAPVEEKVKEVERPAAREQLAAVFEETNDISVELSRVPVPAPSAPNRAAPRVSKASSFQKLDLEIDDLEEMTPPRGTPAPNKGAIARPAAGAPAAVPASRPVPPAAPSSKPVVPPAPPPSRPMGAPPPVPPRAPAAVAAPPAARPSPLAPPPVPASTPRPSVGVPTASPSGPVAGGGPAVRPPARPAPPVAVRPEAPPARPAPPVAVRPEAPPARPAPPVAARPEPPPARPAPPVAARPEPPPARPAPVAPARSAAAASGGEGISEGRLKELYGKLVETKRQCNESTAGVSVDGLTRSLRESQQKLREKHAGKQIDFDVVVKDGKAVLRPIIR
jgi:hypothetical protein